MHFAFPAPSLAILRGGGVHPSLAILRGGGVQDFAWEVGAPLHVSWLNIEMGPPMLRQRVNGNTSSRSLLRPRPTSEDAVCYHWPA